MFFIATISRYVPTTDRADGIDFTWPHGDKTLVQIDHASIVPENTQVETVTMYKLLILLEKIKKVTAFKVSYSTCAREEASQGASDSFKIVLTEQNKYKCLSESGKAVKGSNFFHKSIEKVKESKFVTPIFRFRFERVHGCLKVQKPYVITLMALDLKAGRPLQIA